MQLAVQAALLLLLAVPPAWGSEEDGVTHIDGSSRSSADGVHRGAYLLSLANRRGRPQTPATCGNGVREGAEQCDGSSPGCSECTINAGWVCFESPSAGDTGSICYEHERFEARFQELQEQGVHGCHAKSKLASFRITDFVLGTGLCTDPGEGPKSGTLMLHELVSTSKHDQVHVTHTLWSASRSPIQLKATCNRQRAASCAPSPDFNGSAQRYCAVRREASCARITASAEWCTPSEGTPAGELIEGQCVFDQCAIPHSWSTEHGLTPESGAWCIGAIEGLQGGIEHVSSSRKLLGLHLDEDWKLDAENEIDKAEVAEQSSVMHARKQAMHRAAAELHDMVSWNHQAEDQIENAQARAQELQQAAAADRTSKSAAQKALVNAFQEPVSLKQPDYSDPLMLMKEASASVWVKKAADKVMQKTGGPTPLARHEQTVATSTRKAIAEALAPLASKIDDQSNRLSERVALPPWETLTNLKRQLYKQNRELKDQVDHDSRTLKNSANEMAQKKKKGAAIIDHTESKMRGVEARVEQAVNQNSEQLESIKEQMESFSRAKADESQQKSHRERMRKSYSQATAKMQKALDEKMNWATQAEAKALQAQREREHFELKLNDDILHARTIAEKAQTKLSEVRADMQEFEAKASVLRTAIKKEQAKDEVEKIKEKQQMDNEVQEEAKIQNEESRKQRQEHRAQLLKMLEPFQEKERKQHRKFEAEKATAFSIIEQEHQKLAHVVNETKQTLKRLKNEEEAAKATFEKEKAETNLQFAEQQETERREQIEDLAVSKKAIQTMRNETYSMSKTGKELSSKLKRLQEEIDTQQKICGMVAQLEGLTSKMLTRVYEREVAKTTAAESAFKKQSEQLNQTLQATETLNRVVVQQIAAHKAKASELTMQTNHTKHLILATRAKINNLQPVDCVVSVWGEYSKCQAECGEGKKFRTRKVLHHPDRGGASCPKDLEQAVPCTGPPCPVCGDGIINQANETCDTGKDSMSGCNDECGLLEGWSCAGHNCDECGNGQRKAGEQCDDGNELDDDGCNSKCQIQEGFVCVDSAKGKSACFSTEDYKSKAQHNLLRDIKTCSELNQHFVPTDPLANGECVSRPQPEKEGTPVQKTVVSYDSDVLGLAGAASGYYELKASKVSHAILGTTASSQHEHSISHHATCQIGGSTVCANAKSLTRECVSHSAISCMEIVMEAKFCNGDHGVKQMRILPAASTGAEDIARASEVCVFEKCRLPESWTTPTGIPVDNIDWCGDLALDLLQ